MNHYKISNEHKAFCENCGQVPTVLAITFIQDEPECLCHQCYTKEHSETKWSQLKYGTKITNGNFTTIYGPES